MKRLFLLLAFLASCSSTFAAEKYALLIGVTKYAHAQMNRNSLKYPEADADAVAELLKRSGYEVKVLLGKQATQKSIQEALIETGSEGTTDGVVLIGLFGHGVQYGNEAFYGPYETKIRGVKDFKGQDVKDDNGQLKVEPDPASMISMRSILDALTLCGAGSRILLADCCREDPSAARGRAFGSNLQKEGIPKGMAALFACSENEQAFEHDEWGHGAFTKVFLDECSTGGDITAARLSDVLYKRVSDLVRDKTNGRSSQSVNGIVNGYVDLHLEPLALPELITNSIGMKLKLIPAGEFMMGSPDDESDRFENEGPQHRVRITKPFYVGITEVTQGEWFTVMKTKPWEGQVFVKEGDRYPATHVSWDDAVEYSRKLSALEGKGYRLPTEAEWEYACRGGKSTAYSFGNDASQLSTYAWWGGIDGKGSAKTERYAHEVGGKQSNPIGLYDMHGNVYEWCSDWYESYRGTSAVDPKGPLTGSYRVLRGGGWSYPAWCCRSAFRLYNFPSRRFNSLGFRLALNPSGQ